MCAYNNHEFPYRTRGSWTPSIILNTITSRPDYTRELDFLLNPEHEIQSRTGSGYIQQASPPAGRFRFWTWWLPVFAAVWLTAVSLLAPHPVQLMQSNWMFIIVGFFSAILGNISAIGGGIVFIPVMILSLSPASCRGAQSGSRQPVFWYVERCYRLDTEESCAAQGSCFYRAWTAYRQHRKFAGHSPERASCEAYLRSGLDLAWCADTCVWPGNWCWEPCGAEERHNSGVHRVSHWWSHHGLGSHR